MVDFLKVFLRETTAHRDERDLGFRGVSHKLSNSGFAIFYRGDGFDDYRLELAPKGKTEENTYLQTLGLQHLWRPGCEREICRKEDSGLALVILSPFWLYCV